MNKYLTCIFISALLASLGLLLNLRYLASDDSLFYLQIAYDNLSLGQPSFNGSVITNGFHPLQMICLLIIRNLFFWADKISFMFLAFAFGFICNCLSIWLLSKITKKLFTTPALQLLICSFFAFYIFGGMYFSEASVNALMLITLIWQIINSKSYIKIGLICGLCILARLDNIFTVGFLSLYILYKDQKSRTLLVPLFCGAILLPYLIYNYYYFGALMPVSGQIKSTFPQLRDFSGALAETTLLSKLSFLGIISSLLLYKLSPREAKFLNCFLLGAATNWIYYFLFQEASFHSWYFVQALLAVSITLPARVFYLTEKLFSKIYLGLALLFLLALPLTCYYKSYTLGRGNLNELIMGRTWGSLLYYDVATSAAKRLPEKSRVLVFDLPGYIAYFGNLSVFAIDCLTLNSQACKQLYANPQEYLNAEKITHIIWSLPKGCQEILELKSYYQQKDIGSIKLDCQTAEMISTEHSIYSIQTKLD